MTSAESKIAEAIRNTVPVPHSKDDVVIDIRLEDGLCEIKADVPMRIDPLVVNSIVAKETESLTVVKYNESVVEKR